MSRLKALVSECGRPGGEASSVGRKLLWAIEGARRGFEVNILEGYSILRHMLEASLPDEGDVASVCCLQSPR